MRSRAVILLSVFSMSLQGCASPKPAPNLIAGKYYLAGDKYCKTARPVGQDRQGYFRIECYDEDGKSTGHRYAMSSTNLQEYHQRQAQLQVQRNAEAQALIDQMNRTSQSFNQAATAFRQQGMSFSPHRSTHRTTRCGLVVLPGCNRQNHYLPSISLHRMYLLIWRSSRLRQRLFLRGPDKASPTVARHAAFCPFQMTAAHLEVRPVAEMSRAASAA